MCHYCGWETLPHDAVPEVQPHRHPLPGMGTEKLHAELEKLFPQWVIQRMDSDTMTKSPAATSGCWTRSRPG